MRMIEDIGSYSKMYKISELEVVALSMAMGKYGGKILAKSTKARYV
jgi:hypothetical protein